VPIRTGAAAVKVVIASIPPFVSSKKLTQLHTGNMFLRTDALLAMRVHL
jgi:hypothetical protein